MSAISNINQQRFTIKPEEVLIIPHETRETYDFAHLAYLVVIDVRACVIKTTRVFGLLHNAHFFAQFHEELLQLTTLWGRCHVRRHFTSDSRAEISHTISARSHGMILLTGGQLVHYCENEYPLRDEEWAA